MTGSSFTVGIVGAGPVGLTLAGALKAGVERMNFRNLCLRVVVYEIDPFRRMLLEQMPLRIDGKIHVEARLDGFYESLQKLLEREELDVLIIATKAYVQSTLGETLRLIFQKQQAEGKKLPVWILSAQNGIDTERVLADKLPFPEIGVARMVINFGVGFSSGRMVPQLTMHFQVPPSYVGSSRIPVHPERALSLLEMLAQVWTAGGIPVRVISGDELLKRVWEKTILNSSISVLCAWTRRTMKEVMEDRELREIVRMAVEEGVQVARAFRIPLPPDFVDRALAYLHQGGSHMPSLAVDVLMGKPTEIHFFSGKIVEYAEKKQIPVPIHRLQNAVLQASSPPGDLLRQIPWKKGEVRAVAVDVGASATRIAWSCSGKPAYIRIPTRHCSLVCLLNLMEWMEQAGVRYFAVVGRLPRQVAGFLRKERNVWVIPEHEALKAWWESMEASRRASVWILLHMGAWTLWGARIRTGRGGQVERVVHTSACGEGAGFFLEELLERFQIPSRDAESWMRSWEPEKPDDSEEREMVSSVCNVYARTDLIQMSWRGMSTRQVFLAGVRSLLIRCVQIFRRLEGKEGEEENVPVVVTGGVFARFPVLVQKLHQMTGGSRVIVFPGKEEAEYSLVLGALQILENEGDQPGKKHSGLSGTQHEEGVQNTEPVPE